MTTSVSASLILTTGSAFLALIVPLRASGLMEGPRWRGYMDQPITTGVTPLRYYAGKWATSQPFFLGLLAATLPIVVLFALLGGVSLGRTLVAYVLLYAYCNLLLAVACALGVVLHEVVALLATWLIFSTATIFEYTPTPSTFAAWTPHRFLLQPFVGPMAGAGAGPAEGLYGAPLPFGFEVPWAAWALGLWAVVFLLAGVTCCLGPLHAFVPGLNNFGAVVLAGDAKRLFFRRIRPFLTRRVELAFLFENRGPRLVRRTLTLRALQQVGILAVLAVVLFGAALHPVVIAEMRDLEDEMTVRLALAAGLWLLALLYVLATGRTDAMQRQRVGPLRIPLLAYDVGVFFVAAAVLYGVHALSIGAVWSDLAQAGATRRWDAVRTPEAYFVRTSTILGIMTTTVFGAFLLMKVVGCRVLGRGPVFFLTLLYLLALLLVPVFFVALSASLLQAEEPSIRPLGRPLWVLGQISPATAIASVAGLPRALRDVDSDVERTPGGQEREPLGGQIDSRQRIAVHAHAPAAVAQPREAEESHCAARRARPADDDPIGAAREIRGDRVELAPQRQEPLVDVGGGRLREVVDLLEPLREELVADEHEGEQGEERDGGDGREDEQREDALRDLAAQRLARDPHGHQYESASPIQAPLRQRTMSSRAAFAVNGGFVSPSGPVL